jgi:FkbM family methyltransferase
MCVAMNLSGILKDTFFGKLLRSALKLIPPPALVPIRQGPLRGKKWIAGSSTHGCWVGSFEYQKQQAFRHVAALGDVVYDLGANVGFYSLLASVLVGRKGKRHVEMNRLRNCTIVEAAAAATDRYARFDPSPHPSTAHLSEDGQNTVRTVRVDTLLESGEIRPPNVLKIDVEGAELRALRGSLRTIEAHRPTILLATHGPVMHQSCLQFLGHRGYRLASLTPHRVESTAELIARAGGS